MIHRFFYTGLSMAIRKAGLLQRITLTYGRGARVSIEESLLPRASTVHNNKSTAVNAVVPLVMD